MCVRVFQFVIVVCSGGFNMETSTNDKCNTESVVILGRVLVLEECGTGGVWYWRGVVLLGGTRNTMN